MFSKLSIKGWVEFTFLRGKEIIRKVTQSNLITNKGLETIAEAMIVATGDVVGKPNLGRVYIGLGSDEGLGFVPAPSPTDLVLANELPDINISRKLVLPAGLILENKHAIFEVLFQTDEGNPNPGFNLVDAGLFWVGALATRNTGIMVSRVLMIPPWPKDLLTDTLDVRWIYEFNRKETG